jgi:hypothetical protein
MVCRKLRDGLESAARKRSKRYFLMTTKSKVAVLFTKPESVIEDYHRLLSWRGRGRLCSRA